MLTRCGLPYTPLNIPYLDSSEGIALLEAELRVHGHDQRMWEFAPTLIYRHLMRSGLSAAEAGAIVGRSGHTIHTGAADYRLRMKTAIRTFHDAQVQYGFMRPTPEDIRLIDAHLDHVATQTINRSSVQVRLHERLFI